MGGQRHASVVLPLGKTPYSFYRRLGGPQSRSGQVRKISLLPGFCPRTVQPVASRYTDWAIQPCCKRDNNIKVNFISNSLRPSMTYPSNSPRTIIHNQIYTDRTEATKLKQKKIIKQRVLHKWEHIKDTETRVTSTPFLYWTVKQTTIRNAAGDAVIGAHSAKTLATNTYCILWGVSGKAITAVMSGIEIFGLLGSALSFRVKLMVPFSRAKQSKEFILWLNLTKEVSSKEHSSCWLEYLDERIARKSFT